MLRNLLRDWWRGFTNEDLVSMLRKTERPPIPGGVVWLSDPEYKAWLEWTRHGNMPTNPVIPISRRDWA